MAVDPEQLRQSANALLKVMKESRKEFAQNSIKQSLDDDLSVTDDQEPIWLILTTKKHVVDKKRLKPGKILLPHSLHTLSTDAVSPARICLITADPQRTYKDIVSSPAFPAHLRSSISRVIGITKLKAKFKSFESRRQLAAQHDIFLADDRIINMLPNTLGKTFYKGGEKRPIPVELAGNKKGRAKAERDSLGQKRKPQKVDGKVTGPTNLGTTETVAREIERALSSALVHLSPSATTAVKVARAGMKPADVAENIETVCKGMVDRFVPQGSSNVRAVHIKGPNTMALPVWMTQELWAREEDVLDEKWKPTEEQEAKIEAKKALKGSKSKRKLLTDGDETVELSKAVKKRKSA